MADFADIYFSDLRNPLGDFFHIAHTHSIWGVDGPFWGHELRPISLGKNRLIYFNIADI